MNDCAVAILIVARNTGAFIGNAIASARAQTFPDIEIIVLDDGSTDDTRAVAEAHAAEDARLRVLDGPQAGLAAIRNASLDAARARRVAILDSDDMLHPAHIERLLAAAARTGAEMVAGNMLSFSNEGAPELFIDRPDWRAERLVSHAEYVRVNHLFGEGPSLGYLKPLFDLDFLRRNGIRYDPRLRIGEDYDLVHRTLSAGARFLYLPEPTYYYRRHAASTSHRLSRMDLEGLSAALESESSPTGEVAAAMAERRASIAAALAHHDAVDALKARRPLAALRSLSGTRGAPALMAGTVREVIGRRLSKAKANGTDEPCPEAELRARLDSVADRLIAGLGPATR